MIYPFRPSMNTCADDKRGAGDGYASTPPLVNMRPPVPLSPTDSIMSPISRYLKNKKKKPFNKKDEPRTNIHLFADSNEAPEKHSFEEKRLDNVDIAKEVADSSSSSHLQAVEEEDDDAVNSVTWSPPVSLRIVVGTTSKARIDILTQLGWDFETSSPNIDER